MNTIGFARGSDLACFMEVDYTSFQTFVNVPQGLDFSSFTIDFVGMDDGSRISMINAAYPDGLVIEGSYVLGGQSGSTDLSAYLVAGVNRVVITQVDDCAAGNNPQSATVTLNGNAVRVGECVPPN